MALAATGLQTQIWNNRAKSTLLLAGFPLLLLLMLWAYFAIIGSLAPIPQHPVTAGFDGLRDYGHIAFIIAAIWFCISFFFHQAMINLATGARSVTRQEQPRIYNLLENLCISRGITTPRLCIIDSPALNAYASGLSDKNYTVTLTRGIIDALDDEELEAVIAHELTHIMNRDVQLLVISVVFVGMISLLCEMVGRGFFRGMRFSGSGSKRGNGIGILVAYGVLMVGYLFAIVIRFALSRKREFMADAGAVELTKNPDAMIRALRKISGNADMPDVPDEARQMFIENRSSFLGIFATHPSIEDRIEALVAMGGKDMPINEASNTSHGPWG